MSRKRTGARDRFRSGTGPEQGLCPLLRPLSPATPPKKAPDRSSGAFVVWRTSVPLSDFSNNFRNPLLEGVEKVFRVTWGYLYLSADDDEQITPQDWSG